MVESDEYDKPDKCENCGGRWKLNEFQIYVCGTCGVEPRIIYSPEYRQTVQDVLAEARCKGRI